MNIHEIRRVYQTCSDLDLQPMTVMAALLRTEDQVFIFTSYLLVTLLVASMKLVCVKIGFYCDAWPLKPKFHYADFATFTKTFPLVKSRTQIVKVRDTDHVVNFHDLRLRQSPWTLSPTFPIYCNGLNSIRATQTGLSWTCHGLCRKHLDMSRWFVFATFMIFFGDFHRNFMISWFVTVWVTSFMIGVRNFPHGKVSVKVRSTGIWALPHLQLHFFAKLLQCMFSISVILQSVM